MNDKLCKLLSVLMLSLALIPFRVYAQDDSLKQDSPLRTVLKMQSASSNYYSQESMSMYTPNTYAFGRYGDVPVDYSTGKANISIPLTSVQSSNLSVDISLSYYAGGIKVDQEASTVGLGWSLLAGGVITRQVRGIPDDFNYKGVFKPRSSIRMEQKTGESNENFLKSELDKVKTVSDACALFSGLEDPAPDLFFFNFCGMSGSFYLDNKGHGQVVKNNGLKIDMLYQKDNDTSGHSYFRIVDDKGIEYVFDVRECTYLSSGGNIMTAWYLSSMKHPIGDFITFSYTEGGVLTPNALERRYTTMSMEINPDSHTHTIPTQYANQSIMRGSRVNGVILSKITSSTGAYVKFVYDKNQRKDGDYSKGDVLTKVIGYNTLGQIIKQYTLTYDYFQVDEKNKQPYDKSFDFLNYRLKLCSVQEISKDGNASIPPYRMHYYGDDGNTTYWLPYRMSPSQDAWGYNNGMFTNKSLFPNNSADAEFHIDPWYSVLNSNSGSVNFATYKIDGGADRSFNGSSVKAAMLKQLTYPLGGFTIFEYGYHEINSMYGNLGFGGVRIEKITNNDNVGNVMTREFSYGSPVEPTTCGLWENHNHTFFNQRVTNGVGGQREVLQAFGIETALLDKQYILQITANPVAAFGIESEFCYPRVTETINGKKRIEYGYMTRGNVYDSHNGAVAPYYGKSLLLYDSTTGFISDMVYSYEASPCVVPFVHYPNNDWGRGELLYKKVYNENGGLTAEDTYQYKAGTLTADVGYKACALADNIYIVSCDYVFSGYSQLESESHWMSGVNVKSNYSYESMSSVYPAEKLTIQSNGKITKEKFRYPKDYQNYFSTLVSKNIFSPIDIRTYVGDTLVAGIQVRLNEYGQMVDLFKFDGEELDIPFLVSSPFTFSPYIHKEYSADSHVLLSEYFKNENKKYNYIWSYNETYPIAKLEQNGQNADATLLSQLRQTLGTKQNPTDADYSDLYTKLNTISNSVFMLYKYIPSVGISETIDSRNLRYKYEYDNFCRLAAKKLCDGSKSYLVEDYQINYKQ